MKNILYYLVFSFGFWVLYSCSPNQDENGDFLIGVDYSGGADNGGTTTPSRLLKEMKTHLKDEDTGEIEDEKLTYNYSGAKLISYKDAAGETTKIDYNSNNKISKVYNSGQTSVLEYSGSNVSKVTTTLAGIAKITTTYSYTGGKLIKAVSVQEYSVPIPVKAYIETSYQYQGENMAKSVIKTGIYDPVSGNLEISPEEQSISFTYDSKKSPYKLLPTEFILYMTGIGPQGGAYLSTNNFEKITYATDNVTSEVITFSHTYDSENYPTESTAGDEYISYKYQ